MVGQRISARLFSYSPALAGNLVVKTRKYPLPAQEVYCDVRVSLYSPICPVTLGWKKRSPATVYPLYVFKRTSGIQISSNYDPVLKIISSYVDRGGIRSEPHPEQHFLTNGS